MLEVGDKSGTVEVDPELEGIEVEGDEDFDDLAAPPKAARPAAIGGGRGSVRSSKRDEPEGSTVAGKVSAKVATPTMSLDLDEDDDVEFLETRAPEDKPKKKPSRGTSVRNAVASRSRGGGRPSRLAS